MNAKHLVATLVLALAAGATFAALKQTPAAAPAPKAAVECAETETTAVPRVVVTAKRLQADTVEAPVARVVVTAKRLPSNSTVAVAR